MQDSLTEPTFDRGIVCGSGALNEAISPVLKAPHAQDVRTSTISQYRETNNPIMARAGIVRDRGHKDQNHKGQEAKALLGLRGRVARIMVTRYRITRSRVTRARIIRD